MNYIMTPAEKKRARRNAVIIDLVKLSLTVAFLGSIACLFWGTSEKALAMTALALSAWQYEQLQRLKRNDRY